MQPPDYSDPAQVMLAPDEWALVEALSRLGRNARPRAQRTAEVVVELDPATGPVTMHDESETGGL